MRKFTLKEILFAFGCIILFSFLLIYNLKEDKMGFFDMSFSSFATLGIAIFITFLFSRKEKDISKQKEVAIKVLDEISATCESGFHLVKTFEDNGIEMSQENGRKQFLLYKRKLSNRLDLIVKISDDLKYDEIKRSFSKYKIDFDNACDKVMMNDFGDIRIQLNNISSKALEMMFNLYSK